MSLSGSARTIKTIFSGDAKGLIDAGAQGVKAVKGWQDGIAKASTAILSATAGIAVGLGKLGSDFDSAYDTIRQTTGKTGAQFAALQKDFKSAVVDLPASFGDVSQALADLNQRTGLTGQGLVDMTKQMVLLGKISGEDTAALIASTTRVFGDWNIATKDQAKALDALWRASQATGIGVDQLASTVVQFGAPLRQLGFSFEESITMLGKWEKEGVNTELVLGGLKKALGAAAKAGVDPVKALDKLTTSIKNAGTTAKANSIAVEALGVKAGPDFAAAVREGRLDFQSLLDTVANGSETIKGTADQTADFSEKLQELRNRAFVALEPAANAVFDALNKGADSLKGFGDWAQTHTGTVKTLAIGLGAVAAAVLIVNGAMKAYAAMQAVATFAAWVFTKQVEEADAALVANPIGIIVVAIIALVAGLIYAYHHWEGFRKVVDNVGRAVKAAAIWIWDKGLKPAFTALGIAAVAIGKAFVWLWQHLDDAWRAIVAAWNAVSSVVALVWHAIVTAFNAVVGAVKAVAAVFLWLWNNGIKPPIMLVIGIISMLMNFFKSLGALAFWLWLQVMTPVFQGIAAVVQFLAGILLWWHQSVTMPVINAVAAAFGWFWTNAILPLRDGFVAAFHLIAGAVTWWWNTVLSPIFKVAASVVGWLWGQWSDNFNKIMGVVSALGDRVQKIFGAIGGWISGAFGGAVGVAKGAINGLVDLLNKAINNINGTIIDKLNNVPGVSFGHIPTLPRLALGGPALAGREYLVGEKGPEILRMGSGSGQVTSNANAFGPMTIENHIEIGGEVVRVVRTEIDTSDRSKRRKELVGAGAR